MSNTVAKHEVICAVVLAKNESANIGRCLASLAARGCPTIVADSGSKDNTRDLATSFPGVRVVGYEYVSHCLAYNHFTKHPPPDCRYCMILDADMAVSPELYSEVNRIALEGTAEVITAPVRMYIEGVPLRHGSMYPPKPFVFKVGKEYFGPEGHKEVLSGRFRVKHTRSELVHDDRKPYEMFLETQCRYSRNYLQRWAGGHCGLEDCIRRYTGLTVMFAPLYSLLAKGGWLAGKAGRLYALDRLIAELIRRRFVLSDAISRWTRGSNRSDPGGSPPEDEA